MARVTSLIMRSSTSSKSAFTLIEMLTVMAVIAILASLIVGIQAFAQKKAALTRASGEMQTMATACQAYKADEGGFPRDIKGENSDTDALDPRVDGDPTNLKYQKASLYLYKKLTGDENATGKKGDGKSYCEFIPSQLQKDASGAVKFIRIPSAIPTATPRLERRWKKPTGKISKKIPPPSAPPARNSRASTRPSISGPQAESYRKRVERVAPV